MACYDKYWCHKFKTKTYGVIKNYGLSWKFVTPLSPNGMPCYHHMEDQVVINHKWQQYFQLANKWNK
jgi:hypothetical protein